MIKNDLLAKVSGFGFFYRWHPEVALRYLPLTSEIKRTGGKPKILEVGSGGLGIVPYLKTEITGADIEFKPPFHPLLRQIKTSAKKLPFPNSFFDIVITMDMLEHLSSSERKKAIFEIIRVAKKKVFIGVPCGKASYKQDLWLDDYYKKKFGTSYHFLEEQIAFGLPEKASIYATILEAAKEMGKKIKVQVVGNENLSLRLFLMKGWISDNFFMNIFFRKILLLALPILKMFNQPPTYRQLFLINIL